MFSKMYSLLKSGLLLVPDTCNRAASAIADSVTRDQRLQSYIATGGPRWLSDLLSKEASACWSHSAFPCRLQLFLEFQGMLLFFVWVFTRAYWFPLWLLFRLLALFGRTRLRWNSFEFSMTKKKKIRDLQTLMVSLVFLLQ